MATATRNQVLRLCFMILLCLLPSCFAFNLTVLHTNDVHARYDQTNKYSGQCSPDDADAGKCYGGFPRLYTKVRELRAAYSNTVLVDGGDQYQGTIWFVKYFGNITAHFMNRMAYDVMTLGNHEFDLGAEGLRVLMEKANFSIISSNTNASAYSYIEEKLKPSVVMEIGGERVGFVGYTTVETKNISNPGKVTFSDEVTAVTSQVERLTSEGVNKIVCVGHAGFAKDLKIAEIPGVDVVVGGHTNTFLYTGTPPSNEDPLGEYPAVVTRADGTRALVVQDYAFGKYLGFLQVEFNDAGHVVSWSGNPVLLDNSVPREADLVADLAEWRKGVDALADQTVGRTFVFLTGQKSVCRLQECNLGNLISDGFVMQNLRHSDSEEWNHVTIAFMNSGGIRSSIVKGDITFAEILSVHPFRNTVDIVEVNGSAIRQIMEYSATQWDPVELKGGFLQHSGLRVVYDLSKPQGQRVIDIKVKCADCAIPEFVDLEPSKVYKVIMPNFLADGGDGYSVIVDNTIKRHLIGDLDSDVLTEYVSKFSPIIHGLEGRIRFVNDSEGCSTSVTTAIPISNTTATLVSPSSDHDDSGTSAPVTTPSQCGTSGTAVISPSSVLLWISCIASTLLGIKFKVQSCSMEQ